MAGVAHARDAHPARPRPRPATALHVGLAHARPRAGAPALVAALLLEAGQADVAVAVAVVGGARLLLLEGVVVAPPAVAAIGAGGGQPHVHIGGQPRLAVRRGQRVAEQLGRVERAPRGVRGAAAVRGHGGRVRHLAVGLRVVPEVVVGVGVAGQRPVGGAPRLEAAGAAGGARAAVSPHLRGRAAAAPRAPHRAAARPGRGARRRAAPAVAIPRNSGYDPRVGA